MSPLSPDDFDISLSEGIPTMQLAHLYRSKYSWNLSSKRKARQEKLAQNKLAKKIKTADILYDSCDKFPFLKRLLRKITRPKTFQTFFGEDDSFAECETHH